MFDRVARRTKLKIREDIEALGAVELEEFAWLVVSILEGRDDLLLRGHDERGHFIKGVVDAFSEAGDVNIESGAQRGYFSDGFKKPASDVAHAKATWPEFKRLYLFSTEEVPTTKWPQLRQALAAAVNASGGSIEHADEDVTVGGQRILVFDSRRAADTVFEALSRKSSLIARFEYYLPSLASVVLDLVHDNAVPKVTPLFTGREDLTASVRARLLSDHVCVLYGISGIGKTELAAAVASNDGSPWAERIWIEASTLAPANFSFRSVPIQRLGRSINLLSRIKEANTIVVVDDWKGPIAPLVRAFRDEAHQTSSLLLTTQEPDDPRQGIHVLGLNREASLTLLTTSEAQPPDEVFALVLKVTEGNPLVLLLLRSLIEQNELSWAAVEQELDLVTKLPTAGTTLADRLLQRHSRALGTTIDALGFLRSNLTEPHLLRAMVGASGVAEAKRRGFMRSVEHELLRVHELIRIAAQEHVTRDSAGYNDAERAFWKYIEQHLPRPPHHLTRAINLHRRVVVDRASAEGRPGLAVRAYFNLEESAYNQPLIDTLCNHPLDPKNWIISTSVIEAMELKVRRVGDTEQKRKLCTEFAGSMEQCAVLAESGSLVHTALLHHAGKMRLWAGENKEAVSHFRLVLQLDPDYTAARLQLARALVDTDQPSALSELRSILTLAKNREVLATASVSAILAAFQAISEHRFLPLLDEFLISDPTCFKELISLAVTENFAHPYAVVASTLERLGYKNPEFALHLLNELELPEPGAQDDRLNEAAGRIEMARHDALKRTSAEADRVRIAAEMALGYFKRVSTWPDPEQQRTVAKALYRLKDYEASLAVLSTIATATASPFVFYDRAKAYRASSQVEFGLDAIQEALVRTPSGKFRATFLRMKAFLLADSGQRDAAVSALESALLEKPDPPFDAQLARELVLLMDKGETPIE
jgi:tetratricopeptide (TPR) repeat protein